MTSEDLKQYADEMKKETKKFLFNLNQHQITLMDKREEINKIVKQREAFVFMLLYYTIPHIIPLINVLINDLDKLSVIASGQTKKQKKGINK